MARLCCRRAVASCYAIAFPHHRADAATGCASVLVLLGSIRRSWLRKPNHAPDVPRLPNALAHAAYPLLECHA